MRSSLSLAGVVTLASFVGACVLSFPDYDGASGGAPSAGGAAAAGGEAGAAPSGGSSSSAMLTPNGEPCEAADQCESGHCVSGPDGSPICCAVECEAEAPETCGYTGHCLDGSECVRYPDGIVCDPAERCDGATFYASRCEAGECLEQGAPCPGGLSCAPDGVTCRLSCTEDAHCASAACVAGGKCQKGAGEVCSANEECTSGLCGSTGKGRCCTEPCPGSDTCDLDCDETGACVLAPSTTVCSLTAACSEGNQLEAEFCDGNGACEGATQTQPCPGNLACRDADGCWSSCLTNDDEGDARCAEGFWCNVPWFDPNTVECVPKLGPLAGCSRDAMCLSGLCVFVCIP